MLNYLIGVIGIIAGIMVPLMPPHGGMWWILDITGPMFSVFTAYQLYQYHRLKAWPKTEK